MLQHILIGASAIIITMTALNMGQKVTWESYEERPYDVQIKGLVAIVTGGTKGLGKNFVEHLLKEHAKVAFGGTSVALGEEQEKQYSKEFGADKVLFCPLDVTKQDSFENIFIKAKEKFGGIDLLVNNAGVGFEDKDNWERTIDINFKGSVRGQLLAVEHMGKHKGGKGGTVVMISSRTALIPGYLWPLYSTTKKAQIAYTEAMGNEFYENHFNIRTMSLCPALTDSQLPDYQGENPFVPELKPILGNRSQFVTRQSILRMLKALIFPLLLCLSHWVSHGRGLDNGLARTPPMGWMAWQRYRCNVDCVNYPDDCISEKLFRRMADAMVAEGYKAVGYEYIIIDDCWSELRRSSSGRLEPDKKRFPNGIKALSDYVHSKGLKFGIYGDYGTKTCAGYPGTIDNMKLDAQTFAEWEVDYVKLDGCYASVFSMDEGYRQFGRYLNETGRPMVYSCSLPAYQEERKMEINFTNLAEVCNLWRNYDDIDDSWYSVTTIANYFALKQDLWTKYAGPGHWNDPDMLIIGNFGLTYEQSKQQMAIWAILAAPLIMSNNLEDIKPEFKAILQNEGILKINQDPLGIQGRRIYVEKNIEIWTRPITPKEGDQYSYAVAFISKRTDGRAYPYNVTLSNIGLKHVYGYKFEDLFADELSNATRVRIGDVRNKIVLPRNSIKVHINPSGAVFLKATVVEEEEVGGKTLDCVDDLTCEFRIN